MYACTRVSIHVCGYLGIMEENVGSPGAVTHLVRVLGAELGSSRRAARALNGQTISPTLFIFGY